MKIKNQKSKIQKSDFKTKVLSSAICASTLFLLFACLPAGRCFGIWNSQLYAQENKASPIIVNGDQVEYSTDAQEVTASGNVEIIYKGARLTCKKITVNTQTKECIAEGGAKLDDEKGSIEGEKIIYNFQSKKGIIVDSEFRINPYFGKSTKMEKVSDEEFIVRRGYATTCSFDRPHYRIQSKKINLFPNDKIQTKENIFYMGNVPLLYLPRYNHSLKDPLMHVQLMPGKRKEWGPYMLSAWRYNLTQNMDGRVYLDYRNKLGVAGGFGLNYTLPGFGKGDYKFYYTKEKPQDMPAGFPEEYERYFMRWRYKWDVDQQTNITSELYKIVDKRRKQDTQRNILKDYFFREYEEDSQPLSYALLHHNFRYSSIDLLVQKRTNNWYEQLDKLPELRYTLATSRIGQTPFYFENNSTAGNFDKKATTSPATPDEVTVSRLDTTNKLLLPMKVLFLQLTPFVASRQTIYDKDTNEDDIPVRNIFYSGADLSTRFYRIFDIKSNLLGMDINGLRHIITPTVGYSYNHEPSIPSSKLRQIDSVDSITRGNSAALGLSNKLQTKRKGQTVDLLEARVTTNYIFKPKTADKRGSNLSDFLIDLKLLPYSWVRVEAEATYQHSSSRSDPGYKHFSEANYDISFDLGKGRSVSIGQRYVRASSNTLTCNLEWRLTPKWKFLTYQRYNFKQYLDSQNQEVSRGALEQEYTISRNLHCWDMDITFNTKKNEGSSIWFIFKLKAFPEMEFGFNQSYSSSKSGSQSNP